jgi:hypothetical protein
MAAGLATPGNGQVLLEQNFPTVNLGFQSDYLRRGSGYGQLPETANEAATATGVTVLNRPHPEYDPLGLRFGDINVRADATAGVGYDSNPLALPSSRGSGFVATQAELNVANDRERSGINAGMTVQDLHYFDLPEVNHTDWTATIGGHYDLERGRIDAGYSHLNLNVLPTSIDTTGQNVVVPFTDDVFQLRYTLPLGRFKVIPQVTYSIYRFGQSVGVAGTLGANGFDETVNDRNELTIGTTLEYEFSPGRNAVLVVRGTEANFTNNPIGGASQDFGDVQVLTGLDVQTQGKFRYRALVGYENRSYSDSRLKSQNTPIFEGQIIWTPTQLTTVTGTVSRTIEYSLNGAFGSNNFTYTTGRLQVDHEIRRNIIGTVFGQIQNASYQGNGGSATIYDAGLSLSYRINRHLSLVGSYEYLNRSGDSAYRDNVVLMNVRVDL